MSADASVWAAVVSAIAAWVAALIAYQSFRMSKRSLRLAEDQARQRQPKLVPYLTEGYVKSLPEGQFRVYAFAISLSNPSDADNSVAKLELQLSYSRASGTDLAIKLHHDSSLAPNFLLDETVVFPVPGRIGAHQTVAGWALFRLDDAVLADADIDAYEVLILDTHGLVSALEPIIIREFADEERISKGEGHASTQP